MLTTSMKGAARFLLCMMASTYLCAAPTPKISTQITLNGEEMSAYFNDGDTFKILDGEMKDTRVRIAGYNTLETYGPVHQWMDNRATYLHGLANDATRMAQGGEWNCTSDNRKDAYGRLLAFCDDLALALIDAGLAHAYSIDDHAADRKYISSQRTAISKKLGIWKYGVPEYIVTSLHSADEGEGAHFNRLISTVDGHTKKWAHNESYRTCQVVCVEDETSCMVYVPFEKRYGSKRPDCLR